MAFTLDTHALTTLADAKEQLGIPTGVTTDDNVVTRIINSVTDQIEKYLDRKVLSRSFTEYQDGRRNNRILTGQWPVTSVAELWDDPASEFTDTTLQFAASDFALDGDTGDGATGIVLLRSGNANNRQFIQGTRNIKIVYTAGYTSTPYSILEAAMFGISFFYDKKNDKSTQIESKNKNTETTRFLSALPPFIIELLEPYRRAEWPQGNRPVING